jgi:hypothetical protein
VEELRQRAAAKRGAADVWGEGHLLVLVSRLRICKPQQGSLQALNRWRGSEERRVQQGSPLAAGAWVTRSRVGRPTCHGRIRVAALVHAAYVPHQAGPHLPGPARAQVGVPLDRRPAAPFRDR